MAVAFGAGVASPQGDCWGNWTRIESYNGNAANFSLSWGT